MMGRQKGKQTKLFYESINIEERVAQKHLLRRINKVLDFDFIYKEVEDRYGSNGNVSVPPPVILKLMVLLVLYNVRSERELMETLPVRLDWLWFLGFDIDGEIPDHSVLSKARGRGLWRMQIQDYLIAAVQNIQTLMREKERRAANAARVVTDKYMAVRARLLFVFRQISLIILCGKNIIDDSELALTN